MSYCNFGVTYNFVIEFITLLHTIYHFTFLLVRRSWNHSNRFMHIRIKILSSCFNLLETISLKALYKLMINQVYTAFGRLQVFCFVYIVQSAFKIVYYR